MFYAPASPVTTLLVNGCFLGCRAGNVFDCVLFYVVFPNMVPLVEFYDEIMTVPENLPTYFSVKVLVHLLCDMCFS